MYMPVNQYYTFDFNIKKHVTILLLQYDMTLVLQNYCKMRAQLWTFF